MEEIRRAIGLSLDQVELKHVLDYQEQGTWDEQWIPAIADQGWIIITGDRGGLGRKQKGAKLPIVCKRHGVTHVVLSATIHNKNSVQKLAAILTVWPELMKLVDAPRGSRHLLRIKGMAPGGPVVEQIDPLPELPLAQTVQQGPELY